MTKEQEQAIQILQKEYLCVDRDCDIERSCGRCDLMIPSKEPILKAYKIAIQAIEDLDKIRAEIDRQHKWLLQAGYTAYNVDIAFDTIKAVIAESENKEWTKD